MLDYNACSYESPELSLRENAQNEKMKQNLMERSQGRMCVCVCVRESKRNNGTNELNWIECDAMQCDPWCWDAAPTKTVISIFSN